MAGEPITNQFMLTSASLLLGPMADQKVLTPTTHSIGLVKNVQVTADPQFVELTYGISSTVAMTVKRENGLKIAAEVYEYTPQNIAYMMGLNGASGYTLNTTTDPLNANVSGGATTAIVTGDKTSTYSAGKWIFIQENIGGRDVVHIAKVVSSAFSTNTTITFTGWATPTGVTFSSANARIGVINKIDLQSEVENHTMACRIVGLMAKDKRPIIIHMPKVKVTKGFSLTMNNDNFSNLPLELTPYQPLAADDGYSADFAEALSIFPGG